MECLFALFLTFSSSDSLITRLPFITQTSPMVSHPIWETISTCGPSDHLSRTQHQTVTKILTPACTCTLQTKGTGKQRGSVWMWSDICSVPVADGEPIRPPAASATLHLPAPALYLHRGTHGSWHLKYETVWHVKRKAHERPLSKEFISDFSKRAKKYGHEHNRAKI